MACVADRELYVKTRVTLERLLDYAFNLRHVVLAKGTTKTLKMIDNIYKDVVRLIEDLSAWDEDEEICYDEFYTKIRNYTKALNYIEQKYREK